MVFLGVVFLVKSQTREGVVLKMLGRACVQYHTLLKKKLAPL